MLSVRRPRSVDVEAYRTARAMDEPTCVAAGGVPVGFVHDVFRRDIGVGDGVLHRAREGLRQWVAHRGAGVEVYPSERSIVEGETVALVTRQLGVWVLASCRITEVIDEPNEFGFTYATLPGHPECGWESFVVEVEESVVRFKIEAVSRPALTIMRLGKPIVRRLQRRATLRYLDGLERWARATV